MKEGSKAEVESVDDLEALGGSARRFSWGGSRKWRVGILCVGILGLVTPGFAQAAVTASCFPFTYTSTNFPATLAQGGISGAFPPGTTGPLSWSFAGIGNPSCFQPIPVGPTSGNPLLQARALIANGPSTPCTSSYSIRFVSPQGHQAFCSGNVTVNLVPCIPPGGAPPAYSPFVSPSSLLAVDWIFDFDGQSNPASYNTFDEGRALATYHDSGSGNDLVYVVGTRRLFNGAFQPNCSITDQIVVHKYDSTTGAIGLNRTYSGAGTQTFNQVAVDPRNGDVIVLGTFFTPSGSDILLLKYTASGANAWSTPLADANGGIKYDVNVGGPRDLKVDQTGNFYVLFKHRIVGNNTGLGLSKFSSSGNLLWEIQSQIGVPESLGTWPSEGEPNIVLSPNEDFVYVGGGFIEKDPLTGDDIGSTISVLKYDASTGIRVAQSQYPPVLGFHQIAVDVDGNVYGAVSDPNSNHAIRTVKLPSTLGDFPVWEDEYSTPVTLNTFPRLGIYRDSGTGNDLVYMVARNVDTTVNPFNIGALILQYDGATGSINWNQFFDAGEIIQDTIPVLGAQLSHYIAIDPNTGDLAISANALRNDLPDSVVLKYAASNGNELAHNRYAGGVIKSGHRTIDIDAEGSIYIIGSKFNVTRQTVLPPMILYDMITIKYETLDPPDGDGDGFADFEDACPNTPAELLSYVHPFGDGCADQDGDGLTDEGGVDLCPTTPPALVEFVDASGCADQDGDSVSDEYGVVDQCPTTPPEIIAYVNFSTGCVDRDGDSVLEDNPIESDRDQCPLTPSELLSYVDLSTGCADQDGDGLTDEGGLDQCPTTPAELIGFVNPATGCSDKDLDGVPDEDGSDLCPDNYDPRLPQLSASTDFDLDSVPDVCDPCPFDNPDSCIFAEQDGVYVRDDQATQLYVDGGFGAFDTTIDFNASAYLNNSLEQSFILKILFAQEAPNQLNFEDLFGFMGGFRVERDTEAQLDPFFAPSKVHVTMNISADYIFAFFAFPEDIIACQLSDGNPDCLSGDPIIVDCFNLVNCTLPGDGSAILNFDTNHFSSFKIAPKAPTSDPDRYEIADFTRSHVFIHQNADRVDYYSDINHDFKEDLADLVSQNPKIPVIFALDNDIWYQGKLEDFTVSGQPGNRKLDLVTVQNGRSIEINFKLNNSINVRFNNANTSSLTLDSDLGATLIIGVKRGKDLLRQVGNPNGGIVKYLE